MDNVISGCRLFYDYSKSNRENAQTVLFLHGWGCDHTIFAALQNQMKESFSILSVDFPGHGNSDETPCAWGVEDYGRQIVNLLKMLNLENVLVIAHSFGGRIAIWLSAHEPSLIQKLVLTGAAGIRPPASPEKTKKQIKYERWKKLYLGLQKVPGFKAVSASAIEKLHVKYGSPDYIRLSPGMRNTFVKIVNEDLSPLLSSVCVPTLLIWGSADSETPLWMGKQMEKEFRDAALIVFDGRTHFAFLEEPERFRMIVQAFFQEESAV